MNVTRGHAHGTDAQLDTALSCYTFNTPSSTTMTEHTESPFEQSDSPPAIPPTPPSAPDATASSPTPARLVRSQSPSPSPSAAAINDNPPTPHSNDERERETVNDPRVIALRGMFPDYDDLILCALHIILSLKTHWSN